MDRKNLSPQEETARILIEFLEVAISTILNLKQFYPRAAFERRRYMNVVVHKARHPQLASYIHSVTSALFPYIHKGLVERVVVIFYDKDHVPIERFVFKVDVNQTYRSDVDQNELEFALRAFLVKLTVAEPVTKMLPPGCNWEITAYFRSLPQASSSKEPQLWIPTDTKQWMQPPDINPVKSLRSEPLNIQLYIEHPNRTEPKHSIQMNEE